MINLRKRSTEPGQPVASLLEVAGTTVKKEKKGNSGLYRHPRRKKTELGQSGNTPNQKMINRKKNNNGGKKK